MIVSARAAMSWAIGHADKAPLPLPYDLPSFHAGTEAAAAAALAVLLAECADLGPQHWQINPTDVLTYYVGQIASNFWPYERPWKRDGARASMSGGSYPAAMFECSDGWVSIMCRTDQDWAGLLDAMGRPEWCKHERFRDPRIVARFHADEADVHLEAWLSGMTRDEAFALSNVHKFPMAPVLDTGDAMVLDQFASRGFFEHDSAGNAIAGKPWRFTPATDIADGPILDLEPGPQAPLAGLKVLDLSWAWSGPMVTSGLRDLGAEILKVENRRRADPTRVRGAAIRDGEPVPGPPLEVTPYFNQVNHGKKSIAIDFTTPQGAELIVELAAKADIVVENMRPGVLSRRGLTYERLSARNPGLIMVSMSLMGQHGPMKGVGGYAPVMSGLSGLDSVVGYGPGDLVGLFNPALGDPNGAGHALAALMAALLDRRRTGRGTLIDLSQTEALVSIERIQMADFQKTGRSHVPADGHRTYWPHGTWQTANAEEWIAVAARTDEERSILARLIGLKTVPDRAEFEMEVQRWASTRQADEAEQTLVKHGIPASRVRSFEDILDDPISELNGIFAPVDHPYLGRQPILGLPWQMNGHKFPATEPGPLLGAHTRAILGRELGLTARQLDELESLEVIEK
ncbi:CoA transferase [Rhodococcus sp. NCIMB 12038]|uniref:CaiB/BaiF CoA-transferase family protein n=1 Tax=Rhodococcus sp. NCIMB 12038 TaxID=933800 RepID=UPI00211B10BE|nr:CoA transferase [Rhodococcus sp. NCIMB 12038]